MNSIRTKTIFGVAAIEATLLALLIITATTLMGQMVDDNLSKRASTTASLFASATKDAVLAYDLASLDTFATELLSNPDIVYVRIRDGQGRVLSEVGDVKQLSRPYEEDTSLSGAEDGIFDTSADISEAAHHYGRVEIGINTSSIDHNLRAIGNWISTLAILEMLLVAMFSLFLGTYLTKQLKQLQVSVRRITKGVEQGKHNIKPIELKGSSELSEVANSVNQLVCTIEQTETQRSAYQQELENLNQTLEQKVAKRTQMLEHKNQQLEEANLDIKAKQQQLMQAEKLASVGQLAAGVAHEINNPVGFVSSNIESLRQYIAIYKQLYSDLTLLLSDADPAIKAQHIEKVRTFIEANDMDYIQQDIDELLFESIDGMKRVRDIVKGLKQFSRIDSSDSQWIDINESIASTLKMVNNELKYHCNIEQDLQAVPKLKLNAGKISQVLTNLLINAGQAIEEKGTITVKTRSLDDQIRVTICDDGKGIEPENLRKLFDPFFTTKAEGVGTGLGLAITYGIIQEYGGSIDVDSILGKGTCFIISLPKSSIEPTEEAI